MIFTFVLVTSLGSRFTTNHDFGYVTLDIMKCVPEDSGVYMCKAINNAGEAVSSCTTRVIGESLVAHGMCVFVLHWQQYV